MVMLKEKAERRIKRNKNFRRLIILKHNYFYIFFGFSIKMKFAHLADCHLGSWRQPELRQLNLESFRIAIDTCIKEKVSFVIISGDLFDSAYPPVEILEETFFQLKKLKDSDISCYLIAGSHDYSASGKTFLSVLEKAGFCQNLFQKEEKQGRIFLNPTIHENIALYGYPGKKSGLEISELRNIKLQDSPLFKILALHTCIEGATKTLPIDFISEKELPKVDYYALGHLHINYAKERFVYSGPIFPNNFSELGELKGGSFYIIETEPFNIKKQEIKLKEIEAVELKISNALTATDAILRELEKRDLKDKIVLLKLTGKLEHGKTSDINFKRVEGFVKEKQACVLLKSTSKLITEEPEFDIEIENIEKLEEEIINRYAKEKPSKFNNSLFQLINTLSIDKQEDETSSTFHSRLFSELDKILNLKFLEENMKRHS
jgi:hypothetical protein